MQPQRLDYRPHVSLPTPALTRPSIHVCVPAHPCLLTPAFPNLSIPARLLTPACRRPPVHIHVSTHTGFTSLGGGYILLAPPLHRFSSSWWGVGTPGRCLPSRRCYVRLLLLQTLSPHVSYVSLLLTLALGLRPSRS